MPKQQKQNSTDRIQEFVSKIKDNQIRSIVEDVIDVEISYRSSSRKNFPTQKLRDIIDGHIKAVD